MQSLCLYGAADGGDDTRPVIAGDASAGVSWNGTVFAEAGVTPCAIEYTDAGTYRQYVVCAAQPPVLGQWLQAHARYAGNVYAAVAFVAPFARTDAGATTAAGQRLPATATRADEVFQPRGCSLCREGGAVHLRVTDQHTKMRRRFSTKLLMHTCTIMMGVLRDIDTFERISARVGRRARRTESRQRDRVEDL